MLAALLGLCGVFVGAFMTQLFASSSEWRGRRLDAMVGVAVASGRVIGAHDRLYDLLQSPEIPALTSDRAIAALKERSDAHVEWRAARARLAILIAEDQDLYHAMQRFDASRGDGSRWVMHYIQKGEAFRSNDVSELQDNAWKGMRKARHEIMDYSRVRAQLDARWSRRLTGRFSRVERDRSPEQLDMPSGSLL
jgi:hypothetical protein